MASLPYLNLEFVEDKPFAVPHDVAGQFDLGDLRPDDLQLLFPLDTHSDASNSSSPDGSWSLSVGSSDSLDFLDNIVQADYAALHHPQPSYPREDVEISVLPSEVPSYPLTADIARGRVKPVSNCPVWDVRNDLRLYGDDMPLMQTMPSAFAGFSSPAPPHFSQFQSPSSNISHDETIVSRSEAFNQCIATSSTGDPTSHLQTVTDFFAVPQQPGSFGPEDVGSSPFAFVQPWQVHHYLPQIPSVAAVPVVQVPSSHHPFSQLLSNDVAATMPQLVALEATAEAPSSCEAFPSCDDNVGRVECMPKAGRKKWQLTAQIVNAWKEKVALFDSDVTKNQNTTMRSQAVAKLIRGLNNEPLEAVCIGIGTRRVRGTIIRAPNTTSKPVAQKRLEDVGRFPYPGMGQEEAQKLVEAFGNVGVAVANLLTPTSSKDYECGFSVTNAKAPGVHVKCKKVVRDLSSWRKELAKHFADVGVGVLFVCPQCFTASPRWDSAQRHLLESPCLELWERYLVQYLHEWEANHLFRVVLLSTLPEEGSMSCPPDIVCRKRIATPGPNAGQSRPTKRARKE